MLIIYEAVQLDHAYRIDLLVDKRIVVELKTVERFHYVHTVQVLTYLILGGCKLGLLINFNLPLWRQGIKRIIK